MSDRNSGSHVSDNYISATSLKKVPRDRTIQVAVIGGVATVLAALLGLWGGHSGVLVNILPGGPKPTIRAAPAPTVTVTKTVLAVPSRSPSAPLPSGVTVRRSADSQNPITLSAGYAIDLDDTTLPNWTQPDADIVGGRDLVWNFADSQELELNNDYAIIHGNARYASCAAQNTPYQQNRISRPDLHAGEVLCIRTDQNRYAAITILTVDVNTITLTATVWDPPFQQ